MNSKFKRVEKVKVASQLPVMGVLGRFKNASRWRYHHGTLSGYDELDEVFMSYLGSGYGSEMSDCPEEQYKDKNYFMALAKDNDRIVKKIKRGKQDGLVVSRGYLLSLMEKRIKDFDLAMKAHTKEKRRHYHQDKPLWDSNAIAILDIIDYITESESEVTEINFSKTQFDRIPLNNYRGDTDGHNPIFSSLSITLYSRLGSWLAYKKIPTISRWG